MAGNGYRQLQAGVCIIAWSFFLVAGATRAQQVGDTGSTASAKQATTRMDLVFEAVQELQTEVRSLSSQLADLRAEDAQERQEIHRLRDELGQATKTAEGSAAGTNGPSLSPDQSTARRDSDNEGQTFEDRLAALEENQQITAANVREQSQTKVESGSKYRLRLSGIVLLNVFANRGTVDNLDIPEVTLPPSSLDSGVSFGGTLRQSQLEIETFGPEFEGAKTSANITLDFAGGFVGTQNGATKALVRLRTGSVRMDWPNTSIVAGQDSLFIVPLTPSSLASLAVPALAYAGDLWNWSPQVRVEHHIRLRTGSNLLIQAGLLDQLTGDVSEPGFERYATWGEKSGQPAYASRIAWSQPRSGGYLTVGVGGYYSRQYWGFQRHVDGWAGTVDLNFPLGKFFDVSTAFYRGRAVGGIGGAIGQTVLTDGPLSSSTTLVRGLDSVGGWAQLKFKPTANFEINGALGDDSPFAGQLRRFPLSKTYYGVLLSRNLSPFVNFIYEVRPNVLFSTEYRRIDTSVLDSILRSVNLLDFSLGYTF